jgi:hypothetical protein
MLPNRLVPLFALFAVIVAIAAPARAQSITLTESGITRAVGFRENDPNSRLWISRADCLSNDVLNFPVTLSNYGGNSLEVWAGESGNCADATQRSSASATCWRVYSGVPTSYTATVSIRVQDIIAEGKADGGLSTAADCDRAAAASAATGPVSITLYFMLMSGTSNVGDGKTWSTKYDLVGPGAPTGITVGVGGTLLKVSWNSNADTDVTGYTFFCDPPPGATLSNVTSFEAGPPAASGGAGGAGGAPGTGGTLPAGGSTPIADASADADTDASDATAPIDAGVGAGGSTAAPDAADSSAAGATGAAGAAGSTASNSCNNSVNLVAGQPPSANAIANNVCGTAGKADTSVTISPLTDYQRYAVAIASTDAVGNVGPLSSIACGTPSPVVGIYEAYRAAGGTAGGDSCAMGGFRGAHSRWLAGLAGAALLALILRARRRRSA